jgi:uncharacterized protein YwqG
VTRDRLVEAIGHHGLGDRAESILALTRPSISLLPGESRSGTRFGGDPDLPGVARWPEWETGPLAFICQVSLDEVTPLDSERALPRSGNLAFFYDAEGVRPDGAGGIWGFDPKDAGGARVLHLTGELSPRARPVADGATLTERPLRAEQGMTIPPWESPEIEALELSRDEADRYFELHEAVDRARGYDDEFAVIHQLLGHPDQIQGDMKLECQLVTNGLYCGDSSGYEDPRAAELEGGAADWRLLLQIASDEDAGAMWGDLGRLYYWIRSQDLQRGGFDATWLVLQCS